MPANNHHLIPEIYKRQDSVRSLIMKCMSSKHNSIQYYHLKRHSICSMVFQLRLKSRINYLKKKRILNSDMYSYQTNVLCVRYCTLLANNQTPTLVIHSSRQGTFFFFNQKHLIFFLFLRINYVEGTHQKRFIEALLMGTHNIGFHGEIRIISCEYPLLSGAMLIVFCTALSDLNL